MDDGNTGVPTDNKNLTPLGWTVFASVPDLARWLTVDRGINAEAAYAEPRHLAR